MDTSKTHVSIFTHPNHMVSPELMVWLFKNGFDPKNFVFTRGNGRDVCISYNIGVKAARDSGLEWMLFCDNDIRPLQGQSAPFLASKADIVCVRYNTGVPLDWDRPYSFHCGMWRTSKRVLDLLPSPLFKSEYSENGLSRLTCTCDPIRRHAIIKGLTIEAAGFAGHTPRQEDGLPTTYRIPCA